MNETELINAKERQEARDAFHQGYDAGERHKDPDEAFNAYFLEVIKERLARRTKAEEEAALVQDNVEWGIKRPY